MAMAGGDPLHDKRETVLCGPDENKDTGELDPAWCEQGFSKEAFERQLEVRVRSMGEWEAEVELHGLPPAVANALRRVILAEVPSLAIERVMVGDNTSVIHDEVLAHRLGLVPVRADPTSFSEGEEGQPWSEESAAVFRLRASCNRGEGEGVKCVYSGDLEWLPAGVPDEGGRWPQDVAAFSREQAPCGQEGGGGPAPALEDILLAKLKPGQALDLVCVAVKGRGREHAKWSPVGTCWYRLVPEIRLAREVEGEALDELLNRTGRCGCFDPGSGRVLNPRGCWRCLEAVRALSGESAFSGLLELRKRKHSFIFTLEADGSVPACRLLPLALALLRSKFRSSLSLL